MFFSPCFFLNSIPHQTFIRNSLFEDVLVLNILTVIIIIFSVASISKSASQDIQLLVVVVVVVVDAVAVVVVVVVDAAVVVVVVVSFTAANSIRGVLFPPFRPLLPLARRSLPETHHHSKESIKAEGSFIYGS